jgi:replication factor C subunit 1
MAEIPSVDGAGDSKKRRASTKASSKKRKSSELDDDDEDDFLDDDDDAPKKKSHKSTSKPTPKKPRASAKKQEKEESKEMQAIYDSIPTIRAPTPPPRDPETRKFNYDRTGGNASKEPLAAGTKSIPEGADGCLAGLTFVFTGVLQTLGREEGQNLVKRYGGKVTTGPSKKTSYVVIGQDAGPKKLETIRSLGIKSIDEDGLFTLIRKLPSGGGDSKAAEEYAEKQAKEAEKIKQQAEEMEQREKEKEKAAAKVAKAAASSSTSATKAPPRAAPRTQDLLWVDKYAPDSLSSVCGNKTQVEKLQTWLRKWRSNAKSGFKKAGADANGTFRAAMLWGPPGVGKTTAAHLVAKLEGYDIVETNASDTRSKKLMEATLKGVLDTTSVLGYFAGDGKKVDAKKKNLVLIMDEVDGMSAGDRGGVGALAAVAKKTNVPMILICNERKQPKMKPFDFAVADFPFRRPTTDQIRGRIATIAYREKLQLPHNVINSIIEGSNADIRQIINMLSTIKVDNKDMDFDDSKAMSKAWQKHVILKPWDIVGKIMRAGMFGPSSAATLNEKSELYFNDHEFSFLMLQENYLKSQPSLIGELGGKERNMKYLELAEKAASSISDGDLVDRMIHGSQQHWSLMPLHAILSFVKPASYVYGNFNSQVGFASWLGQNSKTGKLGRYVKEIQGHMRLRTSADRNEIRQTYFPSLWNQTVGRMIAEGKEAVPDVIEFMDSYYLTKDDYDAITELGVGPMQMEEESPNKVKKIDSQTKATFTRMYNQQSHPMPFVKASNILGMSSKAGGGKKEKPDLEEAIEDSEAEGDAVEDNAGDDDEDMDLSKDKYVKVPKKKAAAKVGKGGGKRKKADADDDADEEDEKPKKKTAGKKGKKV